MSITYTQALRVARNALDAMIAAGKSVKAALDAGIPDGNPVHPQSAALTFHLASAAEALDTVKSALAQPNPGDLPPLPPAKASFASHVAFIGGGSLSAGDYYSPQGMLAYGAECRRTMTGTPAMTRQQAQQLARQFAHEAEERHVYLPENAIEAASWLPHEWVVAAILAAANGPDERRRCIDVGQCQAQTACPAGRCVMSGLPS